MTATRTTPLPLELGPNLIDHYYRGGDRIAKLRGIRTTSDHQPEEWLAATVSRHGEETIGLARTTGGDLLRDLVAADHAAWVGPDHAAARDRSDLGILVKLLDPRTRLPVHVHPDRAFATSHLDCPYGKTEAWFILDAEPGCAVYLGWKADVDPDELARRREAQDSEWMLSRMNRLEVSPGMAVLVPAGQVHAIDAGIFLAEVQEPTDFSIVLEWSITTSTRDQSHLGIGFDAVMPAVSTSRLDPARLDFAALLDTSRPDGLVRLSDLALRGEAEVDLMPAAAAAYFTLRHAAPEADARIPVTAGFAVVLVLSGSGSITGTDGAAVGVSAGNVFAVPHAFGDWTVSGDVHLLIAGPGVGWPATLRNADGTGVDGTDAAGTAT